MIFKSRPPQAAPVLSASRPFQTQIVMQGEWSALAHKLSEGLYNLLSLWSDGHNVYMALRHKEDQHIGLVSLACENGFFPSIGRLFPPAIRLERAVKDLYGLTPEGGPDARAWLDHGRWGLRHPQGDREILYSDCDPYVFLEAKGEPLHQIPVGPVHAGIIEPGHFRFSANGEVVVRLEERLGFVHKGVTALMVGKDIENAAKYAARVSGDSTVAYSFAFALAVEAALDLEVSEKASQLRVVMAELERLSNHFGDIGAICNDVAFPLMLGQCAVIREKILRTAEACFGHRLMMDQIKPGGVETGLNDEKIARIRKLLDEIYSKLPRIVSLYGDTVSVQDRTVSTGIVSRELAELYSAGGFVGRASGRIFDARKELRYGYYSKLLFDIGHAVEGDVDARVWVRFDEIKASLRLIEQVLGMQAAGDLFRPFSVSASQDLEGVALVEGFRGDIFSWVRIDSSGIVQACHLRDPSWFQWPLLEYAIKGNIVADFPVCNKSFNCSYSGHDL